MGCRLYGKPCSVKNSIDSSNSISSRKFSSSFVRLQEIETEQKPQTETTVTEEEQSQPEKKHIDFIDDNLTPKERREQWKKRALAAQKELYNDYLNHVKEVKEKEYKYITELNFSKDNAKEAIESILSEIQNNKSSLEEIKQIDDSDIKDGKARMKKYVKTKFALINMLTKVSQKYPNIEGGGNKLMKLISQHTIMNEDIKQLYHSVFESIYEQVYGKKLEHLMTDSRALNVLVHAMSKYQYQIDNHVVDFSMFEGEEDEYFLDNILPEFYECEMKCLEDEEKFGDNVLEEIRRLNEEIETFKKETRTMQGENALKFKENLIATYRENLEMEQMAKNMQKKNVEEEEEEAKEEPNNEIEKLIEEFKNKVEESYQEDVEFQKENIEEKIDTENIDFKAPKELATYEGWISYKFQALENIYKASMKPTVSHYENQEEYEKAIKEREEEVKKEQEEIKEKQKKMDEKKYIKV